MKTRKTPRTRRISTSYDKDPRGEWIPSDGLDRRQARAAARDFRDVLAERAAERARAPREPLASLLTRPKKANGIAYLRGPDGLFRRPL